MAARSNFLNLLDILKNASMLKSLKRLRGWLRRAAILKGQVAAQ